jgi:predicted ester cyclase
MAERASRDANLTAIASCRNDVGDPATTLIDQYYTCFNERRFVDAAALFGDEAVLEQLPVQRQERGSTGYLQFINAWLRAFPDAVLTVQKVTSINSDTFDVTLSLSGTHRGALDLEGWVFKPTGVRATFGLREVLELQNGKIVFSTLTCNLHQIVDQLAHVDVSTLLDHIGRLSELANTLRAVGPDSLQAREITQAIGRELDAARQVVRPYYAPRAKPSLSV